MDLSTVSLSTDPPPPQSSLPPQFLQPPSLHPQPPSPTTVTGTATIANATPPSLNHNNNNNHPPYAEMICTAISALKEKDGSSRRAIAKYIEKAYANLPPTHSALLTHHLKRLRNHGQLIMVKKSYKLPRSDDPVSTIPSEINTNTTDSPAHGPKQGRGRGRPPKSSSNQVLVSLGLVDQPKRGRGRPRKSDGSVVVGQRGPKKGRGRPPKAKKRGPGRPKKPKSVAARLGPGRPAQSQDQLSPVAVSYVASEGNLNVNVPLLMPNVPRPRGRPRKIGTGAAATGGVKQPGRPPKKAENSTGRPVGRPKKNVLRTLTETTEAQVAVIGDLKRKLEFFQSKIRQVVSVLKPQLSSESQISAVAAIQDLEGLAAVDISTPLREETQPPAVQS